MRKTLFAVGLLVCPALAGAQTVPASLSLSDAIAIARDNNPAYRQTLSTRTASLWNARSAWANLFIPQASASGSIGYTGAGSQNFLATSFSQPTSTASSQYSLNLNWQLNGQVLAAPGQAHANADAVDADIVGARATLINNVTAQYLTALQSRDNASVTAKQLESTDQALKLAQAKYAVGSGTLLDVRQAQVNHGQAEVALLTAQTDVQVQKLKLFELMGVSAPADIKTITLSDTFPVSEPHWSLDELLATAQAENPQLQAFESRASASKWAVRAAAAGYGPSVSLSAGWSGFTQRFNNLDPIIFSNQVQVAGAYSACQTNDSIRAGAGLSTLGCSRYTWGAADTKALTDANSRYPFNFTQQPFQASVRITIPLWSNFQQPIAVSQAKANQEQADQAARAQSLALRTLVQNGFLTLQTAYQTIAIQDTNRTAAQEGLKLATDRYRVGSGTFLDVVNAQVAEIRAETDYVTAVYNYHKARAALEAAVGKPLN
ncbi:MAG TPA: TolC family protein [Gemmatimonadales bacterium]|jgi:outer membrane protein|nr:TolC family protein [Gemmatimonadales bacterium]